MGDDAIIFVRIEVAVQLSERSIEDRERVETHYRRTFNSAFYVAILSFLCL